MSVTSGWGRFSWSQANWNADVTLKTGWGAKSWGEDEWGELKDAVAQPSGLSITSSIGLVDVPVQLITPTSFEITASQGEAFNPVVVEGISASFSVGSITPRDQTQGLTSSAITASVGAITPNDMTLGLTGQSITISQGTAKAPNQTVIVSGLSLIHI